MTIRGRLERVEAVAKGGRCERCGLPPDGPGRIVVVDDGVPGEGFPDDPAGRCDSCARRL